MKITPAVDKSALCVYIQNVHAEVFWSVRVENTYLKPHKQEGKHASWTNEQTSYH